MRETLKLANHIMSFLCEQEYEELKYFTLGQKQKIVNASKALLEVLKENG